MTTLALSTYWMSGRDWRLSDFFAAGADFGFESFELSGIYGDTFYDEIRPGDFRFVSLHDPAPPARGCARVGSKALRRADIVYTSLDDSRRRQAVSITKNSIDIAAAFGAQVIVLHPGQTSASAAMEDQLKQLFLRGRISSPEADALRVQLATERAYQHHEHIDALHHSLDELLAHASSKKVKLGLENRPTYEITNFAEMGEILSWYPSDWIGYWHDTGHAQVQANIGMTPHIDWLQAYGGRIVGMHLHDAVGIENHRAPGQGNVDWRELAAFVPTNVIGVIEVDRHTLANDIHAGIQYLQSTGWI